MIGDLPQFNVTTFQAIVVPLCALLALRALLRTWTGRSPRRTGLLSFLIWSTAATVISVPSVTIPIANRLGINRGTDLVTYVSILCGISISFYFYHRFRNVETLVTDLVRREAVAHAVRGSDGDSLKPDSSTS